MKIFTVISLLMLSTNVFAGEIHFSDRDTTEAKALVPQNLIGALVAGGVPFTKLKDGIYSVSVQNLNCKVQYNSALEHTDPSAGIAVYQCLTNSENIRNPAKGKNLGQALAIYKIFSDLELVDCAMGGRCGVFIKQLNCTIDTKVEIFRGQGRFACTMTDPFND